MQKHCFVCNARVGILGYAPLDSDLSKKFSEILEKPIPEKDRHSDCVCDRCFSACTEYEEMSKKLQNLKTKFTKDFKNTLNKHGMNFSTYPKKICTAPTVVTKNKKLVLPASKLQPLPADYVLNIANFPTTTSPSKMTLPRVVKSSPTINLKVTVGSAVLTQSIKTTTTTLSPSKTQPRVTPVEVNNSNITTTLDNKSSNSMISFDVNALPKDFLAGAVLTRVNEGQEMKKEIDEEDNEEYNEDDDLNNDDQPMEIDEDCNVVRVAANENDLIDEDDDDKESEKPQYFDVSLLPLSEGSTNDTILGKLQILDRADDGEDDDNDETETIVMTGENGSILRIVSGQKLVYENGEITLADDDDDNQDGDQDGNDSNDESQIELQVSGDEETANAIIAAAQEQGGAFIKVESGEMYRVKSVQSKSEYQEDTSLQMVAQEGDSFRCLLCDNIEKDPLDPEKYSFLGDADQTMQHLKTNHDARIYICRLCNKIMRKRSEHIAHMDEHSSNITKLLAPNDKTKMHECNLCNKKYNSRTLLQEHMNVHSGSRPYTCSICHKSFASKYTHQAHLKTHSERPRPYKCKECPKRFFSQQNLTQHEKTHLGIKDFVCNICGKAFGTQHNLEVHGVVHSGTKPFVCGVCGKAFARRAEVKDHMRIHTGERPFECEICGARFSQRSNLHSHRRATHLDDKRHHCKHCPKRFKRRRLLDYHIKATHTGERPLQCEICNTTFVYPEHYKKHIRIHSGEKPYVCEVCGKSFNSRDNRNTHRFIHSDKKPYECLVCGAGYMRKQLLYAHMNSQGHLAESIVVNQPRVHKRSTEQPDSNSASEKIDTVLDSSEGIELSATTSQDAGTVAEDNTPKIFLTSDKKLILQDGKSTINLVQDMEDPTLLTFIPSMDDATKALQAESSLADHVQMVTSDENGSIRLVQLHVNTNPASWLVNQP